MTLESLVAFVQVAESGSFSRAAERLHMSQSGVTRRIQALEEDVGEALLVRDRRGASPTPAGGRLLRDVAPLVASFERLTATVRDGRYRTPRYTVGTTVSIGSHVIPRLMQTVRRDRPEVTIDVRTGFGHEVTRWLQTGEVALAIVRRTPDLDRFRVVSLYEEELVPVVRPDHPLAGAADLTAGDLCHFPQILYVAPSNFVGLLDRLWAAHALQPRVAARADRVETVRQLVLGGQGIGFLPSGFVRRERQAGAVSVLPVATGALLRYSIVAAARREDAANPVLHALLKRLPASLAGRDPGDLTRGD